MLSIVLAFLITKIVSKLIIKIGFAIKIWKKSIENKNKRFLILIKNFKEVASKLIIRKIYKRNLIEVARKIAILTANLWLKISLKGFF